MLSRRAFAIAAAATALAVSAAVPASAANPPADEARRFIDGLGERAIALVEQDRLRSAASVDGFRQLFRENFDIPYISRFVLGRFWNSATPAQREEYQGLFEAWVVAIYADRFSEYSGERMRVTGARAEGELDTLVQSQIVSPNGGAPVNVEWRVRMRGGSMQVIDVAIENVSMGRTQRQEFESVILRGGGRVEALLQDLRARTARRG